MDEHNNEVLDVGEQRPRASSTYLNLDANKVLTAFGKFGRYQMLTYFITNSVHLFFAATMMIMPLMTEKPKFGCQITPPENVTWVYTIEESCTIKDSNNWTISCQNIPGAYYSYENKHASIASEFDLVCERYEEVEHGSSIFLLGGMLISPIITQLSDLFGRRVTFIIPLYVSIISNMICTIAPNYTFFLVFRFIAGVATSSFSNIAMTLCLESVSTKFRNYASVLGNVLWVAGWMMAGVLKLFITNWRLIYLFACIPGIMTIPYYWCTPESIHWLITQKREHDVKKYISKSMRINRTTIELRECRQDNEDTSKKVKKRTAITLFTSLPLFVNLLLNSYILNVMTLTYWGLSLFSTDLSDDKMTGFFLSGLVEIPGAIIAFIMILKCKRKTVSLVALAVQAIAMGAAAFSPPHTFWVVIFPLIAKCFNNVAWSSQTLLYSEAAPTSVRNVYIGVASFLGDLGSIFAPYLKRLEVINKNAPAIVISIMSALAAIAVLALPETKDKELAADIDDANYDPGPLMKLFLKKKEVIPEGTPMITVTSDSMESKIETESV